MAATSSIKFGSISGIVIGCVFVACSPQTGTAADWEHWRGSSRSGISTDPSGWDGTDWVRGELWHAQVGEGGASPIVVNQRVYLTGWAADQDTLFCLDLKSGNELWRQSYGCPRYGRHAVGDQKLYSGACSTPEFDAATGYVLTLSIDGDLIAWDAARNGTQVWSLNIYDKYKAPRRPEVAVRKRTRRDYGYVSSPLAVNGQVIVEVGSPSGNLVSFDSKTGEEVCRSANCDEAGHTGGPVPMQVDGADCVAVLTLRNLVVTRIAGATAGQTVAEYEWTTDYGNNIATAAVSGDSVIITSSYNRAAMCRLRISKDGATVVWQNDRIASGVCSPVIHDGKVYWAWRGVHCVDYDTGKEIWKGGRIGSQGSCIVTSDDRLIVYGNKGDVILAETAKRSPESYQQLSTGSIFKKTDAWPHVVLSGNKLICRDRSGQVTCLRVGTSRETR